VIQTEPIRQQEWDAICDLIEEVEQDQRRGEFARSLMEWNLAARKFRKVELSRLTLGDPQELDFQRHAICLHSLLAMGEALIIWSRDFEPDQLALLNIAHRDIEASVEDLRQSLREWHHDFSSEEVKHARKVIFGGAP